jgi:hypothetical protein
MKKMQDEQFKTEMKNLEAQQHSAYDQIRFHRLVFETVRIEIKWLVVMDNVFVEREGLIKDLVERFVFYS